MNIIFKKPVNFEGVEHLSIDLNFDALTGKDLLKAEAEVRAMGDRTPAVSFSMKYQAAVAAQAAKVPVEMILSLPAREFSRVTMLVQNFLFNED
ncbi:hypothetical protein SCACP_21330 [Sporomusa carbonis]|uniref:phage tail assembly protein n=1 Tax=Sporomusa carbonis TaxID=3076075 RepID=UPI003A6667D5